MISTIIISILSCLVIILGYTTYNLLLKNEKAEDILISYKEYIDQFRSQLKESSQKIKEIDEKGISESLKNNSPYRGVELKKNGIIIDV